MNYRKKKTSVSNMNPNTKKINIISQHHVLRKSFGFQVETQKQPQLI